MWMIFLLLLSLILEWHVGLIFLFRAFQKHLFLPLLQEKNKKKATKKRKKHINYN